jgi:tRNA A-37 threonylcarbamoyl transferase component Bud32
MSGMRRRTIGVGLLAAGGLAAALAMGRVGLAPADAGPLAAVAHTLRSDLQARLKKQLEALTDASIAAAALPRLKAALAAKVDAPTMVDLFSSENWWRPFKEEFPINRMVTATEVATHGQFETAGEDRQLVQTARRQGHSAAVLGVKGKPYLVTAARVGPAFGDDAPVIELARPADSGWLEGVAGHLGAGLMLTDGHAPLFMAGAGALRAVLPGLAAAPTGEAPVLDPEGRWSAIRHELGPGLHLWAIRAIPGPAPARGGIPPGLWWLAAGLSVVLGLVLLLRRSPATETTQVFSRTPAGQATLSPAATTTTSTDHMLVPSTFEAPAVSASAALALAPALAEPAANLEGRTFGRYRLIKKIADGGQSEIYRAVAHGPQGFTRTFIVKRLKPELARSAEQVAQFIDEARVQASLVHSNVVPVFDFGNLDSEYFIAQEYIVGRDLSRLSDRCVEVTGSPIPPPIAYHIVCETLQALHYAHTLLGPDGRALDIVHRDVSSINIMVTSSGDVKLFDFGIAKSNTRVTRTQAGMIKGNAHFMSPEHARGQLVDARSDVFSVGLVLYFCLTNQALYSGANALEVLYKAACGPTEVELARIAALPPPAPQLLAAALEVDPSRRFETAADFANALNPFAAGAKYQAAELMQGLFGHELRTEMAV